MWVFFKQRAQTLFVFQPVSISHPVNHRTEILVLLPKALVEVQGGLGDVRTLHVDADEHVELAGQATEGIDVRLAECRVGVQAESGQLDGYVRIRVVFIQRPDEGGVGLESSDG